jgi:hypothetical protein
MDKMWDERYESTPFFYGRMPNDFVVSSVCYLPKGKVLCLAEGEGRNSVFLARSGYTVTGVDFSAKAIENARDLAAQHKAEVHYIQADLVTYDIGEGCWDGIVSIFCHLPPHLRRDLHKRAVRGLRKGGVLILEAYALAQLGLNTGGPKDPDQLLSWDSLQHELEGLEFLVGHETQRMIFEGIGHTGPSAVTQVVGIKR